MLYHKSFEKIHFYLICGFKMQPSENNRTCVPNPEGQYSLSIQNQTILHECNIPAIEMMNLPYIQRSKLQFICTYYENKEHLKANRVNKYKSPIEIYEDRGHE